jgi:hypothetical protein
MSKISSSIQDWLKPVTKGLSDLFSSTDDPVISQQMDRSGSLVWHIYHPKTKTLVEFSSESEMLEWLDRHPTV